jgi:hypothetical protein
MDEDCKKKKKKKKKSKAKRRDQRQERRPGVGLKPLVGSGSERERNVEHVQSSTRTNERSFADDS